MEIISGDNRLHDIIQSATRQEILHTLDKVRQGNKTPGTALSDNMIILYGTGAESKTAAAAIVGQHLKRQVYRIDVHSLVSKYVGETEKNLDAVFAKGQESNAILFFDEADALFVERTEVKDSHDRYLNVELNYLLQKIQQYPNFVLLGTDKKEQVPPSYVKYFPAMIQLP